MHYEVNAGLASSLVREFENKVLKNVYDKVVESATRGETQILIESKLSIRVIEELCKLGYIVEFDVRNGLYRIIWNNNE